MEPDSPKPPLFKLEIPGIEEGNEHSPSPPTVIEQAPVDDFLSLQHYRPENLQPA